MRIFFIYAYVYMHALNAGKKIKNISFLRKVCILVKNKVNQRKYIDKKKSPNLKEKS